MSERKEDAAQADGDPLDFGKAQTRFRDATNERERVYTATRKDFRARWVKIASAGKASAVEKEIQAINDAQPRTGQVIGEDNKSYDAVPRTPLESRWERATLAREQVDREHAAAREHYLDARRASNEARSLGFADRSTIASEQMKVIAETQAAMATEQKNIAAQSLGFADRGTIAAEQMQVSAETQATMATKQKTIADAMKRYTLILIVVGGLQFLASTAQVVAALATSARVDVTCSAPTVATTSSPSTLPSGANLTAPPSAGSEGVTQPSMSTSSGHTITKDGAP